MEIKKEQDGKWIYPAYGKYLVNSSAKEDTDKLIVVKVFIPLDESNDQWDEITSEEKDRIISAKLVAKGQITSMNESITQQASLISASINSFGLSAEQALEFKEMFPEWEKDVVEKEINVGFRFKYKAEGEEEYVLYEVIQKHTAQAQYPPSLDTASLYKVVNVENTGTKEDPITYTPPMEIYKDLYYKQNDIVYLCIRNSDIPLTHNLSELIDNYVTIAE